MNTILQPVPVFILIVPSPSLIWPLFTRTC